MARVRGQQPPSEVPPRTRGGGVSFSGFKPASPRASTAARGSSRKRDTACELLLRRALREIGLRGYRLDVASLPGRPDIVFTRQRVAIFVDGDFWHGRDLDARLAKLKAGHNAPYWVAKLRRNVERDREHDARLAAAGWRVVRTWESTVRADPKDAARKIATILASE